MAIIFIFGMQNYISQLHGLGYYRRSQRSSYNQIEDFGFGSKYYPCLMCTAFLSTAECTFICICGMRHIIMTYIYIYMYLYKFLWSKVYILHLRLWVDKEVINMEEVWSMMREKLAYSYYIRSTFHEVINIELNIWLLFKDHLRLDQWYVIYRISIL